MRRAFRCEPWLTVACCFLAGCAVNPVERLEESFDYGTPETRAATVRELGMLDDPRSLRLLFEALQDEDLLEDAGNVLVLRGRRWEHAHGGGSWNKRNPVMAGLGETAAASHLAWQVRAKAVWALGELMSRKAKPYIEAANASDSTRVAEEVAIARDKLGFTATAHGYELLADGTTVKAYDAEERWQCPPSA